MNFIDETINLIQAGNGGNGIVSFRKEKYVPYGGPSGGNGGRGGSVIFIGDNSVNTLLKLKYTKKITASNGNNGQSKKKNGAKAPNLLIKVPLGTVVYNHKNNHLIGEILYHDEHLVIAKGGRGGKGNYALANSKNKIPSFAEKGELGDQIIVRVELKILADVGLVGYPNVGKSSLITNISNVKTKIASYPFTTLNPLLGVVKVEKFSFVMADIPGLIKDAHLGKGMGIDFLKHIERCKILIHVCSIEHENIYEYYFNLRKELEKYNPKILKKPQIIVVNKMDLPNSDTKLNVFKEKILHDNLIIPLSVWNRFNLENLKYQIVEILKNYKPLYNNEIKQDYKIFTLKNEKEFNIYKDKDGFFVLTGNKIKKLFYKTDMNNSESIQKFSYILKKIGVEEELKKKGMTCNDKVKIFDFVFELLH